jgi:Domain of unknown function (DUF4365)
MITKAHRQEGLSWAYIQAVAAKAVFGYNPRIVDYGFDLTLQHITKRRGRLGESGFAVNIQARSTTISAMTGDSISYDLDVHTYDLLRIPRTDSIRLLVLLVLPAVEREWLQVTDEELLLRRAAYWYSVRGEWATQNRRSIRLAIPRTQLFTPQILHDFAKRNQRGQQQ